MSRSVFRGQDRPIPRRAMCRLCRRPDQCISLCRGSRRLIAVCPGVVARSVRPSIKVEPCAIDKTRLWRVANGAEMRLVHIHGLCLISTAPHLTASIVESPWLRKYGYAETLSWQGPSLTPCNHTRTRFTINKIHE